MPDSVPASPFKTKEWLRECGASFVYSPLCGRSFVFRLTHQSFGVEGDKQFFVCCNDDSLWRAVLRDEVVRFLAALEVAFFVNLIAEEL